MTASAFAVLAACASSLPPAPTAPETAASTASAQGPQELPAALRRAAYDAPDWGSRPSEPLVAPATASSGMSDAVAEVTSGPYFPQTAPSTRSPITASAAPVALEGAVAPTARARVEVPTAPKARRGSYQPRADLSSLEPVVTTPGRAPRSQMVDETPPPPVSVSAAPSRMASVPAETVPSSRTDDFGGHTRSVMASATPTAPARSAPSGRYAIHLASYRQSANVRPGWDVLRRQYPEILQGLQARGADVMIPGKGEYVRLLVGPFSTPDDARLLCAHLKSLDEYCNVMPFDGTPVL